MTNEIYDGRIEQLPTSPGDIEVERYNEFVNQLDGPTGFIAEKIVTSTFYRLADCLPVDIEEAIAYLVHDKGLTYADCCQMAS